jgi:hypothetical protein
MVPGQTHFAPGININMIRKPALLIQDRLVQNHHPYPTMGGQTRYGYLDPSQVLPLVYRDI